MFQLGGSLVLSWVGDPQTRPPVSMEKVCSLENGEWEAVGTCGLLRETSQDPQERTPCRPRGPSRAVEIQQG